MKNSPACEIDELTILLADADRASIRESRSQMIKAGIRCLIEEASDANALIGSLTRRMRDEETPLPFLILSEIKMRRTNGLTALEWIRQQPRLAEVPVVMLTASSDEESVAKAFELGADGYVIKGDMVEALTCLYSQAKRVRLGELSRKDAFPLRPADIGLTTVPALIQPPSAATV